MKTLIISLLIVIEIFANANIMRQYPLPFGLYPKDYITLEKQGVTEFKYYNCSRAGLKYIMDKEQNLYIVRDDVKIANELLSIMDNCLDSKYFYDREKNEYYNQNLSNHIKELDNFFIAHKNLKNLNIIRKPVNVFLKNNEWHCEDEADTDVLDIVFNTKTRPLKWFYSTYKERLEKILNKRSFTMLALLAEDQNIPDNNIENLKNYLTQKDVLTLYGYNYLLDVLIYNERFQSIKRYKKVLTNDYSRNPYGSYKGDNIASMRKVGFEFLQYSENISDESIKHYDDSLYLVISHKLKVSDEELLELINNIPKYQNVLAYLNYAVKLNNRIAVRLILKQYPKIFDSKKEVSKYLLYIFKNSENYDIIDNFMQTYPYDNYDIIIDPETRWNALDYAKQSFRHSGEKYIKLLEEQGFKSNLILDIKLNIRDFIDSTIDLLEGIGMLLLYLFLASGPIILVVGIILFIILARKYINKSEK